MKIFCDNNKKVWVVNTILLIFSYLIFMRGIGYKELYDMSIYFSLSFGVFLHKKEYRLVVPLLLLLLNSLLFPSITRLWGFCALIFYCIEYNSYSNIILCLIFWTLELCNLTIDNYLLITIVFIIGHLFAIILGRKYKQNIICVMLFTLAVLTIIDMPVFRDATYIEKTYNSVYAPSKTFQRITNSSYVKKIEPHSKIIRETSFFTKIPDSQPGILVFDIDYKGTNTNVINKEWQQPTSWYSNQYIGNQYLLESIRHDGALWSNKGISMNRNWRGVQLSFPLSFSKSQTLIAEYGNVTYLHDSDYFSSYLCNYQKSLLQELVGNTARPNFIRVLNVLFTLLLLFIIGRPHHYKCLIGITFVFIYLVSFIIYLYPREGEIRLVGDIRNSHENNKFDGVPKKIVLAGFDYVTGNRNAKILVVKKGEHAKVNNEKVVIAEDNSSIDYNGKTFKVIDNPIGDENGITDARIWSVDNREYKAKIKVNDIIFIATGSPALQSWNDILK